MRIRRRRYHGSSGNSDFLAVICFGVALLILTGAVKNEKWLFELPLVSALDNKFGRTVLRVVFAIIGVLLFVAGVLRTIKTSSSS